MTATLDQAPADPVQIYKQECAERRLAQHLMFETLENAVRIAKGQAKHFRMNWSSASAGGVRGRKRYFNAERTLARAKTELFTWIDSDIFGRWAEIFLDKEPHEAKQWVLEILDGQHHDLVAQLLKQRSKGRGRKRELIQPRHAS